MPGPKKVWGYEVRDNLYPGEHQYFRQNQHVTGMAADDNRIVLNPYSSLQPHEQESVLRNEAARLYMREKQNQFKFDFDPTPEQSQTFKGTPYENDHYNLRATLLARALSGDPSAGSLTPRQEQWVNWLREQLDGR